MVNQYTLRACSVVAHESFALLQEECLAAKSSHTVAMILGMRQQSALKVTAKDGLW